VNVGHRKFLDVYGEAVTLWIKYGDIEETIASNTSQYAGNIRWRFSSDDAEHVGVNELLPRTFISCKGAREGPNLTIMQFNVLADALCQSQFGKRVSADVLAFEYRKKLALEEIERVSPDILCMEEINHFESWQADLECLGYTGEWIPKYDVSYPPGHRTPPPFYGGRPTDGCAIFLKTSRLFFCSTHGSRFAAITGSPEMTQVLLIASVGSNSTGKHALTVSVSHLKAGPGDANGRMRSLQGSAWVKEMHRFMSEKKVTGPIVLCGDMNESAAVPGGCVSQLCSGLDVSSVYAECLGEDPEFTAIDGDWRGCLDYILASKSVRSLAIWDVPALPHGALPSSQYPSDHLAIAAKLDIDIDYVHNENLDFDTGARNQPDTDTDSKRRNIDANGNLVDIDMHTDTDSKRRNIDANGKLVNIDMDTSIDSKRRKINACNGNEVSQEAILDEGGYQLEGHGDFIGQESTQVCEGP
jgi:nocturnin